MTAAPGGAIALLISEAWADFAGAYMSEILPNRINRVIWHEKFAQYRETAFVPSHRHLFIHRKEGDGRRWNPDPIRVPSERMRMGDKRAKGPRVPSDVWTVRRLQGTSKDRVPGHPCQLPPEPLERLVLAYTNPGDLIAESFCGVGSLTRVAARLGRRYVGVDTNTDYVNIARQRGLDAIEEAQANEGAA
jgi:DNA modification methylase